MVSCGQPDRPSAPTSSSSVPRTQLPCDERDHGGMPITLPRRRRRLSLTSVCGVQAGPAPAGHSGADGECGGRGGHCQAGPAGDCGRCLAHIIMLPAAAASPVCPPAGMAGSKACARVGRRRDTSNRPAGLCAEQTSLQLDRSGPQAAAACACALGVRACVQLAACAVPTETNHKAHRSSGRSTDRALQNTACAGAPNLQAPSHMNKLRLRLYK